MPGNKEERAALLGGGSKVESYAYSPLDLVIADDPKDPLYDPTIHEPLDEKFVKNIQARGVITPIRITIREVDGVRKAYVVVGRTRVRACRVANERRVAEGLEPHVIVARRVTASDDSLLEDKLDENYQRRHQEKASHDMFRAVDLQDRGWTNARIAEKLNCSLDRVRQLLKLNDASDAVKKALDDGLPMTAALELMKLGIPAQQEAVKEMRAKGLDKSASGVEGGGATAAAKEAVAAKGSERIVMTRRASRSLKVLDKTILEVRDELGMTDGMPAPKGQTAAQQEFASEVLALLEWVAGEPLAKEGRKRRMTALFGRMACALPRAIVEEK